MTALVTITGGKYICCFYGEVSHHELYVPWKMPLPCKLRFNNDSILCDIGHLPWKISFCGKYYWYSVKFPEIYAIDFLPISMRLVLIARDVIYRPTSRAYATMSVSVCLSVTEVHWRIIGNLGFKFRSKFTAHCRRGEGSSQQQHLALF